MAFYKPKKIGILPHARYDADVEWLNQQLGYLNEEERETVCKAYSSVFREAVLSETIEHKQANAGRFAANTRLRIFIKKRFAVFNKQQKGAN